MGGVDRIFWKKITPEYIKKDRHIVQMLLYFIYLVTVYVVQG